MTKIVIAGNLGREPFNRTFHLLPLARKDSQNITPDATFLIPQGLFRHVCAHKQATQSAHTPAMCIWLVQTQTDTWNRSRCLYNPFTLHIRNKPDGGRKRERNTTQRATEDIRWMWVTDSQDTSPMITLWWCHRESWDQVKTFTETSASRNCNGLSVFELITVYSFSFSQHVDVQPSARRPHTISVRSEKILPIQCKMHQSVDTWTAPRWERRKSADWRTLSETLRLHITYLLWPLSKLEGLMENHLAKKACLFWPPKWLTLLFQLEAVMHWCFTQRP